VSHGDASKEGRPGACIGGAGGIKSSRSVVAILTTRENGLIEGVKL